MQRFRPLTVEKPKVLLPLVNAPLINYTLEWLVASGVDEASLHCYLKVQIDCARVCAATIGHSHACDWQLCSSAIGDICAGAHVHFEHVTGLGSLQLGRCAADPGVLLLARGAGGGTAGHPQKFTQGTALESH